MRYGESESLLLSGKVTEAHLAPVDEFVASATTEWRFTASGIASHTGTPAAKVRIILNALVSSGALSVVESFVCPGHDCPATTPRCDVEQAQRDRDECLCSGCDLDLAGLADLEVVQVYRSLGQPLPLDET